MELWCLKFTSAKNMENPTSPTAVEQLQKIASEFYHTFLEDENHDNNSAALAVVEVVTKIAQLPVQSARPVKFCRKGIPRTVYIDRNIKEGGNRIYADYFSPNPVYPEHMFQRHFRMASSLGGLEPVLFRSAQLLCMFWLMVPLQIVSTSTFDWARRLSGSHSSISAGLLLGSLDPNFFDLQQNRT